MQHCQQLALQIHKTALKHGIVQLTPTKITCSSTRTATAVAVLEYVVLCMCPCLLRLPVFDLSQNCYLKYKYLVTIQLGKKNLFIDGPHTVQFWIKCVAKNFLWLTLTQLPISIMQKRTWPSINWTMLLLIMSGYQTMQVLCLRT